MHLPTCARKEERGKFILPRESKGGQIKAPFALRQPFRISKAGFPLALPVLSSSGTSLSSLLWPRRQESILAFPGWQPLSEISRQDFVPFVGCDASLFPSFHTLPTVLGCGHKPAPNPGACAEQGVGEGGKKGVRGVNRRDRSEDNS